MHKSGLREPGDECRGIGSSSPRLMGFSILFRRPPLWQSLQTDHTHATLTLALSLQKKTATFIFIK